MVLSHPAALGSAVKDGVKQESLASTFFGQGMMVKEGEHERQGGRRADCALLALCPPLSGEAEEDEDLWDEGSVEGELLDEAV